MKPLQLYSLATPNGQKIGVALEEMRLVYQAHVINIMKNEQFTPEFIAINPNSKIPALIDPEGPKGEPHAVFESGAILLYLAEKTGKMLSKDPVERSETIQWLFFQMGGVGPMFGQFGHFFKYAGDRCNHPYPVERYTNETRRLLKVIDTRLQGREFIVGQEFSIADCAIFPWVECLRTFYQATEHLRLHEFPEILRWLDMILTRSMVKRGMVVCKA